MGNGRFFKFSYLLVRDPDRRGRLHQLRDGDACAELAAVLSPLGYAYGGLVLNTAAVAAPACLQPSDLLILMTRPPLDDQRAEPRKHLLPSHGWLEQQVFTALRPYFDICSRDQVRLSHALAEQLPTAVATRGHIVFRQYAGATYKQYKRRDDLRWQDPARPPRTALYLIYTPLYAPAPVDKAHPPRDKSPTLICHLLTAFGMGGTETLLWAYLLRTRYWREWGLNLDAPRFVLAEMFPQPLPSRPTSLAFATTWPVELVLHAPILHEGTATRSTHAGVLQHRISG